MKISEVKAKYNNLVEVGLDKAVEIIETAKMTGEFFSVWNIKRTTGELRWYKAVRGNVSVYTTGEGMKYDPSEKGLIVVWESMNAEGNKGKDAYRTIAKETIQGALVNGTLYLVK